MTITHSVLVAGIGNIFLGDDGFGPEVLRRVPPDVAAAGVRLCDYGIRRLHLAYDLLEGWDLLVLVDALPCRVRPGTLRVFEADPMDTTPASMRTPWIPRPCSRPCAPSAAPCRPRS